MGLRSGRLIWAAAFAALPLVGIAAAARAAEAPPEIPNPTPYQATQTERFRYPVQLDGHPAVYLSSYSLNDAPIAARLAQLDKKQCKGEDYARQIKALREDQAFEDHYYHEKLKSIAEAKAQLESDQKIYDDYKAAFSEAVDGGDKKAIDAAYGRMAAAEKLLQRDQYNSGPYAEADAEAELQDANSLATLILWLEEMKFICHLDPPRYVAPPPPAQTPGSKCVRTAAVIKEINDARTDPQGYLVKWGAADPESVAFLRRQSPIVPVEEDARLDTAAQRHADDQGPIGLQGHVGTDGSKPMQRIHDAGLFAMMNAEVISVEQSTAAGAIHQLITDQGNVGHPHRDDLFNPMLTIAGVGCGPDKRYGQITVIDLSSPPVK